MAEQEFYVGSVGPLLYDDADEYPDSAPGAEIYLAALRGQQILLEAAPVEDNNAVRLQDFEDLLDLALRIHNAAEKLSIADADEFVIANSAASYALGKLLWSTIKTTLKTYFDTQYLSSVIPYWPNGYWPNGYWPDGYWPSETLTIAEVDSSISRDGWHKDSDTWVYGGASYFYIAGKDVTARFPRGTKLKITQGGTVKYWYVNYSEYSYGNTSVALALTPDYTLLNAAITSPCYSYASNPQGFPACFTHSDSWDGFSTDPSGGCCNYSVEGGMVTLNVYRAVDGTADANNCTINLPLESRDEANYVAFSFGYTVKEATLALGFAYVTQKSYAAILIHAPGAIATDWNTSGNKNWMGQIRYHL